MNIFVLGFNQEIGNLEEREKYYLPPQVREQLYSTLKCLPEVKGFIFLSTCLRQELYVELEDKRAINEIKNILYFPVIKKNDSVIRHLLKVSCGLDSYIKGEEEILCQLKETKDFFREKSLSSPVLDELFAGVISKAVELRRRLCIKPKCTWADIFSKILEKNKISLEEKNILIIGTGKITDNLVDTLKNKKSNVFIAANRNYLKAREYALKLEGRAVLLQEIYPLLSKADIIISSTSAPHFIYKRSRFEAYKKKKNIVIFDFAFPRDIEPEIKNLEGIRIYNLDDIGKAAEKFNFEIEKDLEDIYVNEVREWMKELLLEPAALN